MHRFLFLCILVIFIACLTNFSSGIETDSDSSLPASNSTSTSASSVEDNTDELLKLKQEEALKKKKMEEAKRIREEAVRKTLRASTAEECDWKSNPLKVIKGEICGSYYKVLGLNRKDSLLDKSTVKKAFRQLSLVLHPDKNPSENAQSAFKVIQEAYECLSDELCKENYDNQLAYTEEKIQWQRAEMKHAIIDKVTQSLEIGFNKVSQVANQVVYWGVQVWELAGEFKIHMFDEDWPVGRPILMILLAWKGMIAVQVYGLAFLVVRVNHEIAKGARLFN